MGKSLGGVLMAVLVGAIVWFVLDVIINVAVWISFVAGGGVAIIGVLFAVGVFAKHSAASHGHSHRGPIGAR
jgi:cytochrome c biogenesis protein CcdA